MIGSSYSCQSAHETLEWISAIIDFTKPYIFLANAQVVNFFKDRLWEAVDNEWIGCLRMESVENLLTIPSGIVQDHWPPTLKEFILNLQSLSLPREQADLHMMFPNMNGDPLGNVLSQGMNQKKKHEVEVLSAIINSTSQSVGSDTVIDVGAGQGYLSQVLCFKYQLKVVALDASSHHGNITRSRATRIKKHFMTRIKKHFITEARKSASTTAGTFDVDVPDAITCQITCADALSAFGKLSVQRKSVGNEPTMVGPCLHGQGCNEHEGPIILAGLHACGDLSVTMIRSFLESEDVKALICIGCCYNLLSGDLSEEKSLQAGFPVSSNVKSLNLSLQKNSFDLACQSAGRWKAMKADAGIQNFELHVFRAAFQMVLYKYYPDILLNNPTVGIGRQGKALRRKKKGILKDHVGDEAMIKDKSDTIFLHFCKSALRGLDLEPLSDVKLLRVWEEIEGFNDIVGAYWSLRAALGPVLETLILLDRLLFLQEGGSRVDAQMLPIFDPVLSPRNVAIIARKY